MERMTWREATEYEPPPCPYCGGKTLVTFVDAIDAGQNPHDDTERRWLPGTYRCAVECLGAAQATTLG